MYPSSTSSSSQGSIGTGSAGAGGGGLARYGSAPSSFLTTGVNAVVGAGQMRLVPGLHFPSEARDSAAMANRNDGGGLANTTIGLRPPSYGFGCTSSSCSPSVVRQSSSPAGFLNQLATAAGADNNGEFSLRRGIGSCISNGIGDNDGGITTLNSQLSFTRQPESLSHISEETHHQNQQYMNPEQSKYQYGIDANHPILFSVAPRPKTTAAGAASHVDHADSQFHFSLSQASTDLPSMDNLLNNIPEDSVPCKIRAKRGCATHPRSIAERERRTRISRKLKKLQDLVPNMDKQTSYADMLDLAVQHIKTLQNHVQKLNEDVEGCSCGSKKHRDH